jgi:hypothetical protein
VSTLQQYKGELGIDNHAVITPKNVYVLNPKSAVTQELAPPSAEAMEAASRGNAGVVTDVVQSRTVENMTRIPSHDVLIGADQNGNLLITPKSGNVVPIEPIVKETTTLAGPGK